MSSRTIHMSLSVRGVLRYGKRELRRACKWIRRPDGGEFTPDELREALLDELTKGNEVIPFGDCDDFDPKSGCRGHARVESES